jgi:hypothetical protein
VKAAVTEVPTTEGMDFADVLSQMVTVLKTASLQRPRKYFGDGRVVKTSEIKKKLTENLGPLCTVYEIPRYFLLIPNRSKVKICSFHVFPRTFRTP